MKRFTSGFCAVGPAFDESLILLEEYSRHRDWNKTKHRILRDNIFMKNSEKYRETLLIYLRKRYFEPTKYLPKTHHLADFVSLNVSRAAKIQVLYQFTCAADPLIDNLVRKLVAPNIHEYGVFLLTPHVFEDHLTKIARSHPELGKWSTRTKSNVRKEFYRLLGASGVLDEDSDFVIRRFLIRDEAFCFIVYGYLMKNHPPNNLITASLFRRFFLTEDEIESKLAACEVRGWLQYRNAGGIIELKLRYPNMEDWINAIRS